MAVIEMRSHKEVEVVRSDRLVIATNHYQGPKLKHYNKEIFVNIPLHSTFGRYAYLESNLETADKLSIDKAKELMLKPPVLQNWRGVENGDTISAWTVAGELTGGGVEVVFEPLGQNV